MSAPAQNYESLEALLGKDGLATVVAKGHARKKALAETAVKQEGNAIILPVGVTIQEAIEILNVRQKAADQEYEVREFIKAYPFDAAAAFYRVLQDVFGFASSVPYEIETFFGKQEVKPRIMQVRIGPKPSDIMQVPVGGFLLPGFTKPIEVSFSRDRNGRWGLAIEATLKAKDRDVIRELITKTQSELCTNSIYKGKALVLKTDEGGDIQYQLEPDFMATDQIDPANLILPTEVQNLVDVTLFTPIRRTAEVVRHKIPLKRTVALAGPYGTGKTMCAYVTARHCVDNGWTFIMVDKVQGLRAALEFARQYEPAVVFAEDIDRVADTRNEQANDLLNTIDGVLAKSSQVMTVLTTNHIEKIEKAMLRPGRMDAIIPVEAPDADAAQKLVRLFAGKLLAKGENLERLGDVIAGHIPATIREIIERAKLGMINRGDDKITEADLLVAADGMRRHADLIAEKKEPLPSDEEAAGRAIKTLINGRGDMHKTISRIAEDIEEIRERI